MEKKFSPDLETSFVRKLFLGEIIESSVSPFPKFEGEEKETLDLVLDSVDRFMQGKEALFRENDIQAYQSAEYIQQLRELGLFGLIIPQEHEGLGLGATAYGKTVERISSYDASTSLTIAAHSSIGLKGLILFGTPEQKAQYCPRLASGELVAAFCLTEPGSGSDAASIRTNAVKNEDGTWTLNGEKIWITNGTFAGFFTVFAKTDGDSGKLTAFIVERAFAGVSSGKKEDKMGIRASATSAVRFDNVKIPAENVLGGEGQGFKVAMTILNNGRTGLGAGCLGAMKQSIGLAARQAAERKQFGTRIGDFELVREKLSSMVVTSYALESAVHLTGRMVDAGLKDYSLEAAICKIAGSEGVWQVSNDALQIAAGNGYMREYPYERIVRDARINLIFEGTNEILRLYIALTGLKDAGSYLKEIGSQAGKIFNDPIKGFGLLSQYAIKKFSQTTTLGYQKLSFVPPVLEEPARILSIYSLRYAQAAETVLKKYGSGIVNKQLQAKRISDIVIDLYLGFATLSRVSSLVQEKGADAVSHEIQIAAAFVHQAKRRMNQNLRRLISNEDEAVNLIAAKVLDEGKYWPKDVV